MKYIDLNNTISIIEYKNHKEINKAKYTNEIRKYKFERDELLEKYSYLNNIEDASYENKIKKQQQKLIKLIDLIKINIESAQTLRLKPIQYVNYFNIMINKIKLKNDVEYYKQIEQFYRDNFINCDIYLIDSKKDLCLYVHDKIEEYYLEMCYDYQDNDTTYSIYDEFENTDDDNSLFINVVTYTSKVNKNILKYNTFKYGYNYIIEKVKNVLMQNPFNRYMIRLLYSFKDDMDIINFLYDDDKLIYGYGIELIRLYHTDNNFMIKYENSIKNPKTLYCSFKDGGDSLQSARNNLCILEYATLINDISKIKNGIYANNEKINDILRSFPKKNISYTSSLNIDKKIIDLDSIKSYVVLGRTIFEMEVFDVERYNRINDKIKQKVEINEDEQKYLDLGNCLKSLKSLKDKEAYYYKAYKLKKKMRISRHYYMKSI